MKKILFIILVSLFLIFPLYSIGFGYHVLDIRTDPSFSVGGVFDLPVSLVYQFNFPMPDFLAPAKTVLTFRLDNGLETRTLKQDPQDGHILASTGEDADKFPERDYMVLYDEFNLEFSQGFFRTDFARDDLVTISLSLDGRFENAYERLSYFMDSSNTEGLFHTVENGRIVFRSPFSSTAVLSGTPELSSARSVFQVYFSGGLDLNFMRDDVTGRNGVKASTYFRWSPSWLQIFGLSSDFILSRSSIDLAWTMFRLPTVNDLSWLSMMLSAKAEFRYVDGTKVPYYITHAELWQIDTEPTKMSVYGEVALTLFGPQIWAKDFYPEVSGFADFAYSWGDVVNSTYSIEGHWSLSAGARARLVIYNIANVYYEIGCSMRQFEGHFSPLIQRFGFSVGI